MGSELAPARSINLVAVSSPLCFVLGTPTAVVLSWCHVSCQGLGPGVRGCEIRARVGSGLG